MEKEKNEAGARYMTAAEAARALGIQIRTLYTYASRGLIRSEAIGGSKRLRRYRAADVEQLIKQKDQRQNPARVAEDALHWGAPVMESALTAIDHGRLYYRGRDAAELALSHSLEEVAALLWTSETERDKRAIFSEGNKIDVRYYLKLLVPIARLGPIDVFQVLLPVEAANDPSAYDLRRGAVIESGVRIFRLLTAIAALIVPWGDVQQIPVRVKDDALAGGLGAGRNSIAQTLQRFWAPRDAQAAGIINAALVLCADHELNISAFTARCVASAGSTPYAVVNAGLAALQGAKHGGHTRRVQALFQEIGKGDNIRHALAERLKRGETIPGFGHVLYPDGDPRAAALLGLIREAYPHARARQTAEELIEQAEHLIGDKPTIDLALTVLAQVLGVENDAAMTLFALGRTVGWIAHTLEQYQLNQLIRPRARYVGPWPLTG